VTTPAPPLVGIRHVALFVPDLEAAERFWVGVMGYAVEWRPDAENLYLSTGRDNLALHRAPADRPAGLSGPDRLDHIGLAVPRAEDVDAWAEHLARHGVTLTAAPRQHRDGSRSLYFRDPGGILVQIIHHTPISL
jgi:catechol 2,3-dioxygenase-like lactoylglutathione lyase family enzyme